MNNDQNSSQGGTSLKSFFVVLGVVGVLSAMFIAWKLYSTQVVVTPTQPEQEASTGTNTTDVTPVTGTTTSAVSVKWLRGAQPIADSETDRLFKTIDPNYKNKIRELCIKATNEMFGFDGEPIGNEPDCDWSVYLFKTGELTAPDKLKGTPLYIVFLPEVDLGTRLYPHYVYFNPETKKLDVIVNNGETDSVRSLSIFDIGVVQTNFTELDTPPSLSIQGQADSKLIFATSLRKSVTFLDEQGLVNNVGGIMDVYKKEIVKPLPTSEIVFTDPTFGPVYFHDKAFAIVALDGSVKKYELEPYFLSKASAKDKEMYATPYTADIVWQKGVNTRGDTSFDIGGDLGSVGCGPGFVPATSIANGKTWFNEKKLVQIGETRTKKEPVYELSDKATNSYYKEIYEYGYGGAKLAEFGNNYEDMSAQQSTVTDEQKMQDFLSDNPLFFWKDYRGNWHVYKKSKYVSLAECGKPVIYLYPEKTTDVSVQVQPNGGLTVTDPDYGQSGWLVQAKSNGELFNYANKTTYPYLFWEGHATGFGFSDKGFVFAKQDVAGGMRKVLAAAGLNEKETVDFLDFWLPKMTTKPYVYVTFASQSDFDKVAPLHVSPKPDTVIRIFMNFETLSEPRRVAPLYFAPRERKGFTVVEWGGVLQK